jgi:hypothetical protein
VTVEAERVARCSREAEATRRLDRLEARFALNRPEVAEGLGLSKAVTVEQRAARVEGLFEMILDAQEDVRRYKALGIDVYAR